MFMGKGKHELVEVIPFLKGRYNRIISLEKYMMAKSLTFTQQMVYDQQKLIEKINFFRKENTSLLTYNDVIYERIKEIEIKE